jgi:hypothetical protein
MPQNVAPTVKKFSWAGGALCESGPACGFLASTLAHAVPVCAGATGLGFGAAAAGTAGAEDEHGDGDDHPLHGGLPSEQGFSFEVALG